MSSSFATILIIQQCFPNITERTIRSILDKYNFGKIRKIKIVSDSPVACTQQPNSSMIHFNTVYIVYDTWHPCEQVEKRFHNGDDIKIFYKDMIHYWSIRQLHNLPDAVTV